MNSKTCVIIETFAIIIFTIISHKQCMCDRFRFELCENESSSFRVFHDIDIAQCQIECEKRHKCFRLNYKRLKKKCLLYSESNIETGSDDINCVMIRRSDLNVDSMCTCDDRKVCQSDGTCTYEDCPVVSMTQARGHIYGNMKDIGSKVKVICSSSTTRVPDRSWSLCDGNGQWDSLPACLKSCSNPCSAYPYCSLDVPGGAVEGETKTFTCEKGFYSSNNLTENKISVTCTIHGWYTVPQSYCRSATIYPQNPVNIQYVGCETFEFIIEPTSKERAKKLCQAYGDLVKMNSANVRRLLKYHLTRIDSTTDFWIQGHKPILSESWSHDDGRTIKYTDWAQGQPDNTGSCISLDHTAGFKWNDKHCSDMHGYVCRYTDSTSYS